MEKYEMVIRIGMLCNEETGEVETEAVKFEIHDVDGVVQDLDGNEVLENLAKGMLEALKEDEAK